MFQKTAIPAIILFLSIGLAQSTQAQENTPSEVPIVEAAIEKAPTSAEVMRDRISRSKAMLAVRNFPAAIYELENIKRENGEPAVTRVVNVLLMHAYLELSDYPQAQKLLKETKDSKTETATMDYLAVAGQVVNGARSQAQRYNSLGLSINDRNLPTVASADIEGMRTTLEMVVEQSKSMTADEALRTNAAALLEESSAARAELARDAYDSKRWKDQVADAREQMVASRSVVLSATTPVPAEEKEAEVAASRISNSDIEIVEEDSKPVEKLPATLPAANTVAKKTPERRTIPLTQNKPAEKPEAKQPEVKQPEVKQPEKAETPGEETRRSEKADEKSSTELMGRPVRVISSAKRDDSVERDRSEDPNVKSTLSKDEATESGPSAAEENGPLTIGSLIGYATRRVAPIYPRQAKTLRMEGVVTVKIVVGEDGSVAKIDDLDGPPMLTRAAGDAIRRWKFKPFTRNGQPVKATGFVSFNFDL